MRILVIDDEETYARQQCEWLSMKGYDAIPLLSEEKAARFLAEKARDVDMALVDMYMETKESGLNLIKLMHDRYPWILCIVVTAHADFANAVKCMKAGSFSYIIKGETPNELILETIKEAGTPSRVKRGVAELVERLEELMRGIGECIERLKDEL